MNMEPAMRPLLRQSLCRLSKRQHLLISKKYSAQSPQVQEIPSKERLDLTRSSVAKFKRPPFIKKFFEGKLDKELMTYPEILNEEGLSKLESHVKNISDLMRENANSTEIDQNKVIPEAVWQDLKSLGLFGRMIPSKYGGLDLTYTECLRLNEALGLDWSISSALAAHEFFATQVIMKFGSDEQKSFYLPKLASGNLIAALCCAEFGSGSDLLGMRTKATETTEGSFVISGSKSWVSNAQKAGLFVVFAKTTNPVNPKTSDISVFLVDKEKRVKVVPQEKTGLHGLNTGHVTFEEVVVPSSNVIGTLGNGFQVYLKTLESFRIATSTFTFAALKSLLGSVTHSIISKQRVDKSLADHHLVRIRLSRINTMIYAMESVSYFTAALLDSTENPDIAFEAAALKVFNSEGTLFCIKEMMNAVGSSSLMPGAHLERFHRDARALSMIDSPNDICRLFLGLGGCKLMGEKNPEAITKMRNPYFFPKEHLQRYFRQWKLVQQKVKHDQNIGGHRHTNLMDWEKEIETLLQIFEIATENLLVGHGRKIVDRQVHPLRLASVASELYAWSAVLSRASRSHNKELKNSNIEIQLAEAYSHDAKERVMTHLRYLLAGEVLNNDRTHNILGEHVLTCGGYFAAHPLKYTF